MPAALGVLTLVSLFTGFAVIDAPRERVNGGGVDGFATTQANRQLHLVNAHVYLVQKAVDPPNLVLRLGLSVSRATGSITQVVGSLEDGTLRQEVIASPALGLGPSAEAKLSIFRIGSALLSLDVSAAAMLYDRPFPAGGMRYDGMFQVGPGVDFSSRPGQHLALGVRWLHISNGHGLSPRNPMFEGRGLVLRYVFPI